MRASRVFDAFLFSDELDMLELRLAILDPVVDRFVVVESTVTFSGLEKPLAFADNRERFAAWRDKITHVVVRDTPDTGSWRWGRERFQRDQLLRGLDDCRCDDLVLVSDVDEIPDPDAVGMRLRGGYHQEYMLYYLNCRHQSEYWVGTAALYHFELAAIGPQAARDRRHELPRVERGGWHFAYAITPEAMRAKLHAFSHAELDTEEHAAAFAGRRAALTDVFAVHPGVLTELDLDTGYFPEFLKANRGRYAHLLRETGARKAPPAAGGRRPVAAAKPTSTAVLYAYHETPQSRANLEFFARVALADHADTTFVVVVNGERCSVDLPERGHCFVLRRENRGFDFGAHAHGIAFLAETFGCPVEDLPFEHFVFLNSSVAGPFLPSYWPRELHWTRVLTSRLNDRVKLVGPSIVCLPPADAGGYGPRVEGYCFATDRVGLAAALRRGSVFVDHATKRDAIVEGEYGLSRAILAAGHTLDCLLYRYQGVDWTDPANWNENDNRHPSRAGDYGGISIHPFEVVFHKWYWSDQPDRPVAGDYVERYLRWKLDELRRAGGG